MEISFGAGACKCCQSRRNIGEHHATNRGNSRTSVRWKSIPSWTDSYFIWIVTLSLCAIPSCYASVAPPFITQHPEGDVTVQGNVEVLRCSAIGGQPLQYRWWKDGSSVATATSNNFRISDIGQGQAGEYRCLVENPVGTIMSKAADIRVAYIGSFPTKETSKGIMAGEATIIECPPIESYPPPAISWRKDGLPLTAAGRIVMTLDGRLVIIDAMTSDAGNYVCHAENTESAYFEDSDPISFIVTSRTNPAEDIPPSVIIPPQDVVVHEGESLAELECIINARPLDDLEMTWVRGGEVYQTGGLELFKLQLRNPQVTDQGTYECQATLNGVTVSASANLTYYTMPTFVVGPEVNTVSPVGSTVVVPCQASGSPTPSIVWYRNAVDVTTLGDSRYQILSTGSLQIQDLQKPDGAMLQCRISNEVGEDIKDTQLIVKEIAPEFTIYPNDTLLLVGESAFLECQASGAPVPTIQWFKDGAPVASEGSTRSPRYIFESGNLRINDAVTADSGVYKCEATNTKGSINVTISFNVYEQTRIATRPTDIEEVLSRRTVLECVVYSDDRVAPSIVWYHDGREVDITDGRISVQPTGSLEIRSIDAGDAGSYVCRVTSVAGDDEATAELSVIRLPFAPASLTARISRTDSRTIVLNWVASFNGNTPLLRYIIDQKEDLSSYREIESTVDPTVTSFAVVGAKPSRSYQFRIRAENKVGTGDNSAPSPVVSLPEEPPDDPPQRVVASASSTNSIIVEWQEPPEDTWNGDLLGYIVRHRLYGYPNDWVNMNISNVRQTSAVIVGLITWKRYEIQVAGYNRAGVGASSDSVKEQTLEGVPTESPRNVDIRVVNSTAIRFSWSPPNPVAINGINQGYKLHMWQPGMEDDRIEVIVPHDPGTNSYSEYVGGLGKYTRYDATVLCYTNPGNGPPSTPRTLRTHEDRPGPVEDLRVTNVQATSLRLEWDAPTEENGALTTYKVEYFPVNGTGSPVTSDLSPDIHHLHVTQLASDTTYSFSVWAETSVGPGEPQTTIIRSGIPPVTPEAPLALAISEVLSRTANLQFSPGSDGHASISLWTVEALVGASTEWTTVFTISAPKASGFVLTGLRPYTAYTFRMIATNVAGDSPPSGHSNSIQTLPDVPEIPPSELTVRANDKHSLRVRWVPLAETAWNGVARGYTIFWSRASEETSERHNIDDPYGGEYLITGLNEYTEYHVTITAVNDIGEGPVSPASVERTHEAAPTAGPEGLTASAINHHSIQVAWGNIPLGDRNGVIVGYKVLYQESSGSMADEMAQVVEGGSNHDTTLTGLRGYTAYTIMVVGRTRLGDGVPSDTITATTLESAPGPPAEITFPAVTETTARVRWAAPLDPNGVIIDYRITYKIRDTTQIINTHVTDNAAISHYEVSGLQAETFYIFTVTARNRINWGEEKSSKVFTTSQRDVPDRPTNVNVNRVRSRQASLSWTPGDANNAPIRSYRIRLRHTQGSWMDHPSSIPHDALSYTITGLRPYFDYQFKIQAKNDVGWSAFSEPSSYVTTQEDAPEGAPSISDVRPVTTTSVLISWKAPTPETHNGDLLGYKVVFRQLPDGISQSRIIEGSTAESYNLVDLVKFKDYEVKLAAFNTIGDGPLSTPWTVFVGEAPPAASPSEVRLYADGASGVRVTWSAPPADTLNGGLQGYKVTYWPASARRRRRAVKPLSRTYPSTATEVVLDGLECATTYGIQVNGFNAAGDGPASETQMISTEEDVPGEVAFLAFSKIRMTSLDVSWDVPPEACGNISFYRLSYQPLQTVNGEKSSITTEISATKTAYHVMELDSEVPYMFSISARTSSKLQYGPIIQKNVTTGPQPGSPDAPRAVLLDTEDDMVTISWEEPISIGASPLTGYFIEYQEDGKEWMILADEIPPTERFYDFPFQDLRSSTIYSFRVSAENSQGASVPGYLADKFNTAGIHYNGSQVAFYEEWWFLVIVALVGIIIIILVGATLCMLGRSKLYKEKKKGKRVNHVQHPPSTDDGGFQPMELNPTRRAPRNGNYTSTNSYRRPPPKPSPGSVQYSEEEESKHYEPVTGRNGGETVGLTEERYPESVGSESEPELRDEATDSFVNHYGTLPSNQDWRQQAAPQAYSYTDSEPDHNSVAMYNNGLVNMEPGSRNPIQGFSSFV